MNKNIVTAWIDRQNEKLCLKISAMYFKKIERGYTAYAIFLPRFYPFLILRFLLVIANICRFNRFLAAPYVRAFHKNSFFLLKSKSLWLNRCFEVIFTFCGLTYFTKDLYDPDTYIKPFRDHPIQFEETENPVVSILIPVYNQIDYTLTCLRSLTSNVSAQYPYEVILIDDCSTDESTKALEAIKGLKYVRNKTNSGFLHSCRKGVDMARGEFIYLLNNDTIVLPHAIESLIDTIKESDNVGAVGSKLIYPYGLLQEAGGIIYQDGSGVNYGKYRNPNASKYDYKREVDYCSGASLLFKRKDYDLTGGLDIRYAPAYYEDTDFCFTVRHVLKKKVIYQPASVIVHFEGISSGKKAKKGNVKSYQDTNRLKFMEKWAAHLQISYPKQKQDAAAKKYLPEKTVVIIDSYLPLFDRESGSQRLYQLLNIFIDMNLHLQFVPHDGKLTEPYYHRLTSKLGIEVMHKNVGRWSFRKQLANAVRYADMLWICRPGLNKKYKYLIRFNTSIKWIYDTVDLHYIRLERQFLLSKAFHSFYKNLRLIYKIRRSKALELSLAKLADFTIAITTVEAEILNQEGIKNVWIIPNIHLPFRHETPAFSDREDLCFIGSYDHKPNVDAAYWLIDEIMPMVWRKRPDIRLYLLGNNPPPELRSRQDHRIIIPGFIEDVSDYFFKAKIFVAPLRYGAGMKGKIGQSLSFGLPIVSTSIGTEGMNLKDNISVLEANNATDFADKILRLYEDSELWNTIQQHAYKTLSEYTPERIRSRLSKLFSEDI